MLAENLISPRPRGSREAWFRHPGFLHPRSETSSLTPTAIAFTKRLASPPLPPPRSRQALAAREGADRVEGSAPLGLGPAGQGGRELAREKPCCHFLLRGAENFSTNFRRTDVPQKKKERTVWSQSWPASSRNRPWGPRRERWISPIEKGYRQPALFRFHIVKHYILIRFFRFA